MRYKQSLIIKPANNQKALDSFIEWLNTSANSSLKPETIVNQANISLINQEGESIKIKTIREIKEQLSFSAYQANQTRYFVFLDAHLTTIPAQNALLKSIEEPPTNTQIVFITDNPQKLLATIRSRCQLIIQGDQNEKPNQELNDEVAKIYFKIISSTQGAKITIASKYKERTDAILLCNQLVNFLHQELKNKDSNLTTGQITQNIGRLLTAIEHLEHNANVLLALENCFFEMV